MRLAFQLLSGRVIAQAVAEQSEHDLLLAETGRLGQRLDGGRVAFGEVAPQDVLQILEHRRVLVDKEPPFRLEVAELKNQVHGGRCGVHPIDGLPFRRTQVEIEEAVVLGKARQAVEVIDFP